MKPLDCPLDVTLFPRANAPQGDSRTLSARQFASLLRDTNANGPDNQSAKAKLPLIKFGSFARNYRSDAGLETCSAVEGDYDGGMLSMEDAAEKLRRAGISAVLYTSPRHTPEKPRWRVVALLSKPCTPGERTRFLARLNGVLGGVLAPESFALSQSYFYGGVNGQAPDVVVIEDGYVDQKHALDKTAMFKQSRSPRKSDAGVDRSAVLQGIAIDIVKRGGTFEDFEKSWRANEHARGHVEKHKTKALQVRAVQRTWDWAQRETQPLFHNHDSGDQRVRAIELFQYSDPHPSKIPRREFLYGSAYIRGFVSALVAPGGAAKTSLTITEALSMASGRDLLNLDSRGQPTRLRGQLNVCLWNLEDDIDEMERRIKAAQLHFADALEGVDLKRNLYVNAASEPLRIGTAQRGVAALDEELISSLCNVLRSARIDVLIIDPFISSHAVPESDNDAIDRIAKAWSRIARKVRRSVTLVHHVRKGPTGLEREVSVEDARGASALVNACRFARVINRMTKADAPKLGVSPEAAWAYLRVDAGKANLAPPGAATWRHIQSVEIANESAVGAHDGDRIGVVEAWAPTDVSGTSRSEKDQILRSLGNKVWRANSQATDWVGEPFAKALKLDLTKKVDKAQVVAKVNAAITAGWLIKTVAKDERRKERPMLKARAKRTTEQILG